MYNYARIEIKNMHNATSPLVLHGTIAKSRIDENIYNVMSQLVESNFVFFFCIDALRPNQQQWSCWDTVSI